MDISSRRVAACSVAVDARIIGCYRRAVKWPLDACVLLAAADEERRAIRRSALGDGSTLEMQGNEGFTNLGMEGRR